MNAPSFPFYQDIARQRGDTEALRHAADDIDKLRATLDELKALQVNGFDPIAAARAYPGVIEQFQRITESHARLERERGSMVGTLTASAQALLRELGEVA